MAKTQLWGAQLCLKFTRQLAEVSGVSRHPILISISKRVNWYGIFAGKFLGGEGPTVKRVLQSRETVIVIIE